MAPRRASGARRGMAGSGALLLKLRALLIGGSGAKGKREAGRVTGLILLIMGVALVVEIIGTELLLPLGLSPSLLMDGRPAPLLGDEAGASRVRIWKQNSVMHIGKYIYISMVQ